MTDELVKRLREQDEYNKRHYERDPLHEEAAARIEQLTEERDRLREALTVYADPCDATETTPCGYEADCCCRTARAALKGESHE